MELLETNIKKRALLFQREERQQGVWGLSLKNTEISDRSWTKLPETRQWIWYWMDATCRLQRTKR